MSKKSKKFIAIVMTLIMMVSVFTLVVNADEIQDASVATVLCEDETMRSEYEKHFKMSDGSYIATTYGEPVHKQVNGEWVEIDNTLKLETKSKTSVYKTVNGLNEVSFAKTYSSDKLASISDGDYSVSWSITALGELTAQAGPISLENKVDAEIKSDNLSDISADEQKTMASKSASAIAYKNALSQGVDLEYTVLPSRVKESIVLNSKQDISSYVLNVYTENLSARLLDNREIEFYNESDEAVFSMWAPYMYDSATELSQDIAVTLKEREEDHYIVTVTPDSDWLNAPERVYPVTIDPDVSASRVRQNIIDNYVWEGYGVQDENLDRLYIGVKSGKIARAYFKYKTLPTLPKGYTITAATQRVNILDGTTSANKANAYMVEADWDSSTIKWANKPSASTKLATGLSHHNLSHYSFSCLTAVKTWYSGNRSGTNKNYGIMMRYKDETLSDYNSFYSSDCSTESKRPLLKITYTVPEDNSIVWPVPGSYTINSKWGYRTYDSDVHKGIDISCKKNEVLAATEGTVSWFNDDSAGYAIVITKTNSSFQSRYYHLDTRKKASGTTVKAGDVIAISGNSGNVPYHLHFQLQWGNNKTQSYNPLETYHNDDKRYSWTNPNPMFILQDGKYVANSSFNYTYSASDYNSTDKSWKKS